MYNLMLPWAWLTDVFSWQMVAHLGAFLLWKEMVIS